MYAHRLSISLQSPSFSLLNSPFGANAGDFSSQVRQLAPFAGPAKAALFSLASVFQSLSNRHLLRLLFTALVHPLSPDSSGVPTLRSSLDVATTDENGRKSIRLDQTSPVDEDDRMTYAFGTMPGNRRVSRVTVDLSTLEDYGEACVFVLSPALSEVLEFRGSDPSFLERARQNPYRVALFQFLDAPADFSDMRELAICTLDSALSVLNSKFAADMLFGTDLPYPPSEPTDDIGKADSLPSSKAASSNTGDEMLDSIETAGNMQPCGAGNPSPADTNEACERHGPAHADRAGNKAGNSADRQLLAEDRSKVDVAPSLTDNDSISAEKEAENAGDNASLPETVPRGKQRSSEDLTKDTVIAFCRCVMTASKFPLSSGDWKLDYDEIAGHVLLAVTRGHGHALKLASSHLKSLWSKGSSFIASRIKNTHNVMGGCSIPMAGCPSVNVPDYDEQIVGAISNLVFYDKLGVDKTPVAEEFVQVQGEELGEQYSAPVSFQSSFESLCSHVGALILDAEDIPTSQLSEMEEVQLIRTSAVALFQLDALINLLSDPAAMDGTLFKDGTLSGIVISAQGAIVDMKQTTVPNLARRIYAPMSSPLNSSFYLDSWGDSMPQSGLVVDLTEKIALPCVCEAPPEIASYFAVAGTGVVAEGVTWQSLYLSFQDGLLLVCQPKPGGPGPAESIIITACPLERLTVQKDDPTPGVTARRLILRHHWFGLVPPPLFLFDVMPEREKFGPFFRVKMFQSSMDVWFEDLISSENAFASLVSHIFTAKAHRGRRVLNFLEPEEES